ncbi:uncharacterized protein PHALS_12753 [Plasmopara halstedii]|uniref:Uncharacterized protein n=1 Tax=Plasmopara halstedii TaxID=4781 RepID=A0A0N7L5U9_PLAHL|nr:uncharacterized protein PHALS_12753 [Plasmopara halstedii]CEG42483.1 hypothetical protein PHALS_12753 [Plasmopara halstedii]|eukprot:XP_024578852.1 hypothetical protein PHALS_12753 [Plasmopara halstedii]
MIFVDHSSKLAYLDPVNDNATGDYTSKITFLQNSGKRCLSCSTPCPTETIEAVNADPVEDRL